MFHRIRLEPQNSFRLIWGRFVNTVGLKGRNISRDLHLEHVNNQLKELLRSLRSNLNKTNAKRIANSLKNLTSIIENLEKSSNEEKKKTGRKHESFPDFKEDI